MTVSLTPEMEEFVADRVASGRYPSPIEVVRAGLRLLEAQEQAREVALAEVRRKIAIGLEQADRGEVREGEAVFDELDAQDEAWHDGHGQGGSS
jgi:antitoxin ParD1/3/4